MKEIKTACCDWHLSWGYGGHNKVGKLFTSDFNTFRWEGKAVGRHGQVYQAKIETTFTLDENNDIVIINGDGLPVIKEILNAIETLKNIAK